MNRSIESIMQWMTSTVQNKETISPQRFVDAASYLTILIGDEHTKLYDLEQEVAKQKLELLQTSKSVAEAKVRVEALDVYKSMRKQQAYIVQITEIIRVAKLQARMAMDEMKLN